MDTVELRVDNELLAAYEAMRSRIKGREAGRRQDPFAPHLAIIDMDMDDAPQGAVTMELVLERVHGVGTRIASARYYDANQKLIAVVDQYEGGGYLAPRPTFTDNDTGRSERVESGQ